MKNIVKKIMIVGISIILGFIFGGTSSAQTTFDIDDKIFEATDFYPEDYSTIHFGTENNGNSFGGVFFWGPEKDKEIEIEMNGSSIYCKKQIRGLYINQVRGNVVWPLDTTTLWLLKGNFLGYENMNMSGGFFTHCTGELINDYNGIFGYITHTLKDGTIHELWAGIKYTDHIRDIWGDSLGFEYNLQDQQEFVKGIIYDSYGGIGFIDSTFNPPLILRNTTGSAIYVDINITPKSTSLGGKLKFDVDFGTNRDIFLDNVKVFVEIPKNIDVKRDDIGIKSGNTILVYDGKLYPLQGKHFSFEGTAILSGDFEVFANISTQNIAAYDSDTGFIFDTRILLEQNIRPNQDIIEYDSVYFVGKISNKGNNTGINMKIYDILPDNFIYTGDNYNFIENGKLLLFSGDFNPGDTKTFRIPGYFSKVGKFSNTIVAESDNIDTITGSIEINVLTNICGDGIVQSKYETCDDGKLNGKMGQCNKACTGNVIYGVACKYTDANYLKNGPFKDTLNHWGFDYIEVMRRSCLHKGKWGFAGQWRYDPDEYVTKAEVLKTLVKIRGIYMDDFDIKNESAPYNGVQVFADVQRNHRFSWYSFYAFDNNLAEGLYTTKNGKKYLDPDGPITRNQMIKAIMTLYKEIFPNRNISISGNSSMTDVNKGNLYYLYVRQAERLGIISGYDMPDGTKTWQGNNPLTRAEFAKIVSIPFQGILFGEE